ncbi:MAG: hypothetical protein V3U98_02385 [Acidobacteriota bacterium]
MGLSTLIYACVRWLLILPLMIAIGVLASPLTAESKEEEDLVEQLTRELEEFQDKKTQEADPDDPRYRFMLLGVDEDYQKRERFRLKDQILTFIPPLYQPAFVGHGYVLPPRTWRISTSVSSFSIDPKDFFKDGKVDFATHENHSVDRIKLELDVFYGIDYNLTLRINIPYWISQSRGSVHPAGVQDMNLFVEGTSTELGDISIFLKKKFWDQGNFFFNFSGVAGLKLSTGSDSETFDQPMVVEGPGSTPPSVAFGGNSFPRFSDDGRLPSVLQPGTGSMAYHLGLFATRQFMRNPSALHVGALASFFSSSDGLDPGDQVKFFASYVKPIFHEYVSLDATINGMYKEEDSYSGTFTHPVPGPDGNFSGLATTPRPAFRGGTVLFASPSIIFNPTPLTRFSLTAMFRLNEPDLGPWPSSVYRLSATFTF